VTLKKFSQYSSLFKYFIYKFTIYTIEEVEYDHFHPRGLMHVRFEEACYLGMGFVYIKPRILEKVKVTIQLWYWTWRVFYDELRKVVIKDIEEEVWNNLISK
jgi:hypothetical protein